MNPTPQRKYYSPLSKWGIAVFACPASANLRACLAKPVFLVHQHDLRLVPARRLVVHHAEAGDDDQVASVHQMSPGAVDADHAGARLRLERVRDEPGAAGDVPD